MISFITSISPSEKLDLTSSSSETPEKLSSVKMMDQLFSSSSSSSPPSSSAETEAERSTSDSVAKLVAWELTLSKLLKPEVELWSVVVGLVSGMVDIVI
ncbi:hypothetical protein WICPIJ_007099 [Wickerhamomyces pijperi]|uniref:Uncharacterized protein n=1 Tax=Wickerhamomyces pijperi TaxID=599730 RepID=A0A9P8Q168_WICPI|nr:hypothetical protein WICPIJ_007099 [Wickerhamomyces pijperi]